MAGHSCDISSSTISRRRLLTIGAGAAGGFAGAAIAGCTMPGGGLGGPTFQSGPNARGGFQNFEGATFSSDLQHQIESIINAKGTVTNGALQIQIDRNDIRNVELRGVPILPSFEINGQLNFQSLGGTRVLMNSDLCLEREEIDPFIDQLLRHNIIFQAEHQHFYDFVPIVFFIHFRALGDAITIARGVKAALNVTSTPFPQAPPKHPHTPLPVAEIGKIIGVTPTVGANGVVSLQVPRADTIMLGGQPANPYLNIMTPIDFEPLGDGRAAAVPDFGMIASEIQRVVARMRGFGWDIGCLYNQETAEEPQLFFSHQFKVGNPIQLAHEIRAGLELMDVKLGG
ncbi:MAG: DUF1259 domain-containing protein [Candidatus Eremiobacteraeota bacterium]|nr:DUF1259 domain-containing protein [Candidatus Eremiobacteraeota bacterium]